MLYVAARSLGETAFDDSYFFKRFALNFLEHGEFAWNVADGPVHGSTSQLFQLLATALTAAFQDHFVTAVKLANTIFMLVAGAVLIGACGRSTEPPEAGHAVALIGLVTPVMLAPLTTGMETALTFAVLAWSLVSLIPRVERSAEGGRREHTAREDAFGIRTSAVAAGFTVLVYLCRPDAAILPAVFFALALLARRRLPLRFVLVLAVAMGALLLALKAYYGTALPLSFYVKAAGAGVSDEHVQTLALGQKAEHFGCLLAFAAPLLWISIGRRDATTLALWSATLVFWAFHLIFTTEVMGYRARFYAPGMVPLLLAAARSWEPFTASVRRGRSLAFLGAWASLLAIGYASGLLPGGEGFFLHRVHWSAYVVTPIAVGLLLLMVCGGRPSGGPLDRDPRPVRALHLTSVVIVLGAGVVASFRPRPVVLLDDAAILRKHASEVTTVRGIFELARCLPAAKNVYHSEMGVTGLVLPAVRALDLVGLLSKETLLEGHSFDEYCSRDRPEAIFMPHQLYRELNARIRASSCLKDYRQAVEQSASPLFVRADLFDAFMQCALEVPERGR